MTRKNGARADRDYGLICPSCGALSTPDPAALRAAIRDITLWARCFGGFKTIVRPLVRRFAKYSGKWSYPIALSFRRKPESIAAGGRASS
jgi:hypothetical protein